MDISVIIPTYNRAASVVQAVRSAIALDYPADRYEIIVVDNASTDATLHAVPSLQGEDGECNLRYVREEDLGLHNARHAGARVAKGEVLVFSDDDATFDAGWLKAYAKAFDEHSQMAAAGGPVRPVWEVQPPKWLLDFMGDGKTFGPLSLMEPYKEFRLEPNGFFFGVNMAIRRDVLFKVGGFNPELIGTVNVGDGESGLNRKIQDRGWLIGYVPGAITYHHIPRARMTVDYLCRWQSHLATSQLYRRYHMHKPGPLRLAIDAGLVVLQYAGIWILARCMRFREDRLAVSLRLRAALGYGRLRYILRLISDQDFGHMVTRNDYLKSPHSPEQT